MKSLGYRLQSVAGRYRQMPLSAYVHWNGRAGGIVGQRPYSALSVRPTDAEAVGRSSRSLARRSRLEAVLMLSREPLSLRKLAQLANLTDGTEARTLLEGLRR